MSLTLETLYSVGRGLGLPTWVLSKSDVTVPPYSSFARKASETRSRAQSVRLGCRSYQSDYILWVGHPLSFRGQTIAVWLYEARLRVVVTRVFCKSANRFGPIVRRVRVRFLGSFLTTR